MTKKKKNRVNSNFGRVLREIQSVRKDLILFSFDSVFLIVIPIIISLVVFLLAGKYLIFSVNISILLFLALVTGIIGIFSDNINIRSGGWYSLFGILVFAYIFLILMFIFGSINLKTMRLAQIVHILFLFGSYFTGITIGNTILKSFFQPLLFARLSKIGLEPKAKELSRKGKFLFYSIGVIGIVMIILGIGIIYFKAA